MSDKERSVINVTENNDKDLLRVILCKPGEFAEVVEIEDDLESMQNLVGGYIQEYMPFTGDDPRYDDVAIICNEEGKMMRLPPSRAITDENGHVMDVIVGPFFICYAPLESEKFLSMPEDLEEEFRKRYELPEQFYQSENGIKAVRYEPDREMTEQDQTR